MADYQIEMLWQCSICRHGSNRGLKDRYCSNCGHKKDASDTERMPEDMSEAAALSGEDQLKAEAGADWICNFCEAVQSQRNKCCGNCGATERGTVQAVPAAVPVYVGAVATNVARADAAEGRAEARREHDRVFTRDVAEQTRRRFAKPLAIVAALVCVTWLLAYLFTPRLVEAKVSQLHWQHDTLIDRYSVHRHEGWSPSFDAFDVIPLGLRHHHYDRVHVGSHQEAYQDSYACGENCSTSPSYTTCSSNGNGTARCTKHGGTRSCSTKYCTRTAYRTVQDYRNVSRTQLWYAWKAWDWAYNRTISRSGFTHVTTWPSDDEIRQAWLAGGEKERSSRQASYKVTFADLKDGETYFIRPSASAFESYDLGERYRLKVNALGSVEVLP